MSRQLNIFITEGLKAKVKNWLRLIESGDLKNNTVKVLSFVMQNPHTDIDSIRKELKMPHQTATSRISELMDAGLVKEQGQRVKAGLNYSVLVFISDEREQQLISYTRAKEKYIQWMKQGLASHGEFIGRSLKRKLRDQLGAIGSPKPE